MRDRFLHSLELQQCIASYKDVRMGEVRVGFEGLIGVRGRLCLFVKHEQCSRELEMLVEGARRPEVGRTISCAYSWYSLNLLPKPGIYWHSEATVMNSSFRQMCCCMCACMCCGPASFGAKDSIT